MFFFFLFLRIIVYTLISYNVASVSYWASGAFALIFLFIEFIFLLIASLKSSIDVLLLKQEQKLSHDFEFTSEELTKEEADLVDAIRDGNTKAATDFLHNRCNNKLFDFNLMPEQLRLIVAQRLINAINRNESPTWKDLLAGSDVQKNEDKI